MLDIIKQLIGLFTPAQKRTGFFLVVLMFGSMVLETLGIGLVIPAMLMLTKADMAANFPLVSKLLGPAANTDKDRLVITGMLALALVYIVKGIYIAWVTSRQMRFVFRVQADMSRRLFVSYLFKPYTFHLQRNSSQLLRNVVNATNELTMTGLVSLLILATESMVLAGIGVLLLYIEPLGAMISASLLAIFGYSMNRATRRGIRRASSERQLHEEKRIKYLQEAIGGAKELKLLGREDGAIDQYLPHNAASARIGEREATLQALPKLWLEVLAVVGLVVLVLTLVWQGRPTVTLVPTIGMFAAAAFRLIPSMNRILGSMQYIRQSAPIIATLHAELGDTAAPSASIPSAGAALRTGIVAKHVSVGYPESDAPVLVDADFSIAAGTTVGFIGGSGAGKSTLVDALLGLLPLQDGVIEADGVDIHADIRGWQARIGYVPQSIYLVDDSIRRNIAFGLPEERIDDGAVARALSAAQLDDFVSSLPMGIETITGERGVRLSGGQRQRIGIARALYHNPAILVLDEATSSLDTDTENGVMQAVNALHGQKTIIIVTHRLNTLDHCDRVFRVGHRAVTDISALGAH